MWQNEARRQANIEQQQPGYVDPLELNRQRLRELQQQPGYVDPLELNRQRLREQQLQQPLETTRELRGLLDRCYSHGYQRLSSQEQIMMNNAVEVCDEMNAEIKAENTTSSFQEQKEEMMAHIILGGDRTEYRRRVTDEEASSSVYKDLEEAFYLRWKAKNRENSTSS